MSTTLTDRPRRRLLAGGFASSLALVLAASPASAEPAETAPPEHPATLAPRTDLANGQKRPPQDYDGRTRHTSAAEALLWIPRILLSPLYVVTEYGLRKPLGAVDGAVEKASLIPKAIDFLTFGPNNNAGIVPTAFVDFGFRPSIGVYFFYDDFLAPHNDLRFTISTGGEKYLKAKLADRIPLRVLKNEAGDFDVKTYLQLEVDALERPDFVFFGVGPESRYVDRGRFEERTVGGGARLHSDFWKGSFFESWLTIRGQDFADGDCAGPTLRPATGELACSVYDILRQVEAGRYPLPPGFGGYGSVKGGGRLVLDSRKPRPFKGTGVAVDVRSEVGGAFGGSVGGWLSYAASAAGFVDLTGTRRVLGLTLETRFVDPLRHAFEIPFTELVGAPRTDYVPDDDMMRGFVPGRLLGRSSVSATLDYEWPVWSYFDGTVQLAAGNVFGEHLQDFKPDLTRLSFVAGLTSPSSRDHGFNFLLGFGTKTIHDHATPESVRFYLGGTTGF